MHPTGRWKKNGGPDVEPPLVTCALPSRSISLDHLGGLIEDGRRDREAELLGCFQVDDQVELYRPLHGEVRRLCAL